eukprot:gene5257-10514_t
MGRKKKIEKKKYIEIMKEFDLFEQRWNAATENFYLFNPITGEIISLVEGVVANRNMSTWRPPEKVCPQAMILNVLAETYASRRWGRRRKRMWMDDVSAAATHIAAVGRGFIVRNHLRQYYRQRYVKHLDIKSGLYYFQDTYDESSSPSWHKPLLAFPTDILEYVAHDPQDYMGDRKFTYEGFTEGPYIHRTGVGKKNIARTKVINFISENPWRDIAVRNPRDIDLHNTPVSSIIAWMDGIVAVNYEMTDYAFMRSVVCEGDWKGILNQMDDSLHAHREAMICYGLHAISKLPVPIDASNHLTFPGASAYDRCMHYVRGDPDEKDHSYTDSVPSTATRRVFALRVLHSIFATSAGRSELLSGGPSAERKSTGREEEDNLRLIFANLAVFNRVLERIPMQTIEEVTEVSEDSATAAMEFRSVPTGRGIEAVEMAILCLSLLAHHQDYRETIAQFCAQHVVDAVKICREEPMVVLAALQTLYNFCFRCEAGQEAVIDADAAFLISLAQTHFSSDFDISRQCRRLELALVPDGWRGSVETVIESEMSKAGAENRFLREKMSLHRSAIERKRAEYTTGHVQEDMSTTTVSVTNDDASISSVASDDYFDDNISMK